MALNRRLLPLALAVGGGGALLAALYFQYVDGLPPCPLCIDQRWAHGGGIAAALAGFVLWRRRGLAVVALVLASIAWAAGAGIALFHVGVEHHWWAGLEECTGSVATGLTFEELAAELMAAEPVRCDAVLWSLLGVSMAGWNAFLSAVLAVAAGTVAGLRWR